MCRIKGQLVTNEIPPPSKLVGETTSKMLNGEPLFGLSVLAYYGNMVMQKGGIRVSSPSFSLSF